MLSLKSPVFTSGVMTKSSTTSTKLTSTKWGIKRNEERLQKAYEAVRDKKMTLRQASETFGVAKSTLHDRLSGKVLFGSRSGPPRLLTQNEEEALVTFLVHCASVGYPRSRKDVLVIVQGVLDKKGYSRIVSHGWWESFRKRHPDITIRKAEALSNPRYVCVTPEVINNYSDLLEEMLIDNDLMEKPCQIFNCDESEFPLDPPALSVIAQQGQKHPYSVSSRDNRKKPACSIGRNQSPIYSRTPSPTYSPSSPSSVNVLPFSTVMDKVLNTHQPRIKIPNQQAKTSARVLTSFEQRKALQEKEDRKREEEERRARNKAEKGFNSITY